MARCDRCSTRTGRDADYVEIGLDTGVCYNPLHNDLDPYAVAYAIATLLNNLFGRSKEPFWQQAYTDLLKFVILLRRISDGYTTFSEVYRYILDDQQIDRDIRRLKADARRAAGRPRHPPGRLSVNTASRRPGRTGSPRIRTTWRIRTKPSSRRSWHARKVPLRSPEAEGSGMGGTEAPARSRRALVPARLESTRRTAPIVDRRRHRRVPVAVRRQPGGASRVLSATKCVHRRPASRRTEAARRRSTRCSRAARCWR